MAEPLLKLEGDDEEPQIPSEPLHLAKSDKEEEDDQEANFEGVFDDVFKNEPQSGETAFKPSYTLRIDRIYSGRLDVRLNDQRIKISREGKEDIYQQTLVNLSAAKLRSFCPQLESSTRLEEKTQLEYDPALLQQALNANKNYSGKFALTLENLD